MPSRLTSLVSIAAAIGLAPHAMAAEADPLLSHRWRDRVLVAVAAVAGDPRLSEQRRLYEAARAGSRERDLVLVEAAGESARAVALRRRFGLPGDDFRALLVGKDGGAKRVSAVPIAAESLFAAIDAMPMRREEMRRAKTGRDAR